MFHEFVNCILHYIQIFQLLWFVSWQRCFNNYVKLVNYWTGRMIYVIKAS